MAMAIVMNSMNRLPMQTRIEALGSRTVYQTWSSKVQNTEDGPFSIGSRDVKPVRLAYMAYENIRPSLTSNEPPVIIMHDVMDSKGHWENFAKELHSRSLRKVYAVDMRNHGESCQARPMTYVHISEDIKKFMDDLRIKSAFLIGQGMGGRTAMALALRCPRYVERMAVIDASPNTTSEYHMQMSLCLDSIKKLRLTKLPTMTLARRSIEAQLSKTVKDDVTRFIIAQNLVQTDLGAKSSFQWRINMTSITTNFYNLATFPSIRGKALCTKPALFIHGAQEERLTMKECLTIRKLFPNSEFAGISHPGYFVHSQSPMEFMSLMMGFLTV